MCRFFMLKTLLDYFVIQGLSEPLYPSKNLAPASHVPFFYAQNAAGLLRDPGFIGTLVPKQKPRICFACAVFLCLKRCSSKLGRVLSIKKPPRFTWRFLLVGDTGFEPVTPCL